MIGETLVLSCIDCWFAGVETKKSLARTRLEQVIGCRNRTQWDFSKFETDTARTGCLLGCLKIIFERF